MDNSNWEISWRVNWEAFMDRAVNEWEALIDDGIGCIHGKQ